MAFKTVSNKVVLREVRDIVLLIIVGFIMTYLIGYTQSTRQYWVAGSFTALMWVFLWKGNSLLSRLISSRINWLESPVNSLVVLSVSIITYTVGSIVLLMRGYEFLFNVDFDRVNNTIYSAILITIIISLFMHGRSFLIEWKQSVLDAEKLKHENVIARYERLKDQVNPHFLFNSLNALTNLVYENQDLAAKFIKQLSEVYRYVLDTRDKELVSEDEELKFLESYVFLQQIRFGDNLRIDIDTKGELTMFPPLVLQMLVENAIKHNEISTEHPLTIRVKKEDGYVVVENSLQRKSSVNPDSKGVGLANIISRYEFLSKGEVIIAEEEGRFVVKLPVIKPEH
ncbi:MAG: histidine kinase [Cyclobacteriaceae bacterium]|jgi:hypothetical protein|nr:histidine kinase [Cyclobacteriaceae bacterium]